MKEINIGAQIWSAENMSDIVDRDGNKLVFGIDYFYPNGDKELVETYGLLYTWEAANRIAPDGWRLPTYKDWGQLENYCSEHYSSLRFAKALAASTNWKYSRKPYAVGNNQSANNELGFSALPAGYWSGDYYYFGSNAYFWSATDCDNGRAYIHSIGCDYAYVYRSYGIKRNGFSVRLVKDAEPISGKTNEKDNNFKNVITFIESILLDNTSFNSNDIADIINDMYEIYNGRD